MASHRSKMPLARKIEPRRRTKIVATIGPASESADMIRRLILAGMDVARVNFSHGDVKINVATIERIRAVSRELGKPVAILQDLCGPKIRTHNMKGNEVSLIRRPQDDRHHRRSRRHSRTVFHDVLVAARRRLQGRQDPARRRQAGTSRRPGQRLGRPLHDRPRRHAEIEKRHEPSRHHALDAVGDGKGHFRSARRS